MRNIKRLIQNFTGYWIYKAQYLPRGADLFWDIERMCGKDSLGLVFDIGANVGQFASQARRHFKRATIHCFEPVTETHTLLATTMSNDAEVHCHKLALSAESGEKVIFVNPDRTESSLNYSYGEFKEESVRISTVDTFCNDNCIAIIDLMKVDTEGEDLNVLRGAEQLLKQEAIKLLFIETELIETNRHFIPLHVLVEFLGRFGYEVIAIYDQRHHWDGRLSLSFCNVLFGRSAVYKKLEK